MSSQHWDEARADAYAQFRYDFPERTLAGKTVVIAGGTGGLGAATTALLLREGAHLIVGYRKNRESAAQLSNAMDRQYGANLELIEGDIASSEVRGKYIEACQRAGERVDPADRDALGAARTGALDVRSARAQHAARADRHGARPRTCQHRPPRDRPSGQRLIARSLRAHVVSSELKCREAGGVYADRPHWGSAAGRTFRQISGLFA